MLNTTKKSLTDIHSNLNIQTPSLKTMQEVFTLSCKRSLKLELQKSMLNITEISTLVIHNNLNTQKLSL